MGTKVSEDLRKKKSKGTKVSRDLRTNPETWGEWFKERFTTFPDRVARDVRGLGQWKENYDNLYANYGAKQEQDMRDSSWGGFYSPREGLYDLTGYDYGGKASDLAAVPLNALGEIARFGKAGLESIVKIPQGTGKGSGYLLDSTAQSLFGTQDMFEDNPLRDTHEDIEPYFSKQYDNINDYMTKDAERLIDSQVDAYVDYNTMKYENPEMTRDQFDRIKSQLKEQLMYSKYYDQMYDRAFENYKRDSLKEYGVYNAALGARSEEEAEEMMLEMMQSGDFGALGPILQYGTEYGKSDPIFAYSSKEADDALQNLESLTELGMTFGIPGAARSALAYGTAKGLPKIIEKGVREAFPGTVAQKIGGGYRFNMPNSWVRKPLNFLDASRNYGSQFVAPLIIAEMLRDNE